MTQSGAAENTSSSVTYNFQKSRGGGAEDSQPLPLHGPCLLTCPVSPSLKLKAFLNPDRQTPLMPLSLNNMFTALPRLHFKVPSKSAQLPLSKTSPKNLNVAISKNDCDFQQQVHYCHNFRMKLHKLFFQFQVNYNCLHGTYFKALIT